MTTLMIKDLSLTEELSPEQLQKIHGGLLVRGFWLDLHDDYIRVLDPIG